MSSVDTTNAINSVITAREQQVKGQIQTAVAAKSLDAQKQIGDAANQLIEQAAQLSKAFGKGGSFDGVA